MRSQPQVLDTCLTSRERRQEASRNTHLIRWASTPRKFNLALSVQNESAVGDPCETYLRFAIHLEIDDALTVQTANIYDRISEIRAIEIVYLTRPKAYDSLEFNC